MLDTRSSQISPRLTHRARSRARAVAKRTPSAHCRRPGAAGPASGVGEQEVEHVERHEEPKVFCGSLGAPPPRGPPVVAREECRRQAVVQRRLARERSIEPRLSRLLLRRVARPARHAGRSAGPPRSRAADGRRHQRHVCRARARRLRAARAGVAQRLVQRARSGAVVLVPVCPSYRALCANMTAHRVCSRIFTCWLGLHMAQCLVFVY